MIKKSLVMLVLGMGMFYSTGCTSVMSYKYSADEIAQKRILASGNKAATDAMRMGVSPQSALKVIPLEGGAGLMLDITALDALSEHPWRQLGAAILDGAMTYGTYKFGENQGWWGSGNTSDVNDSSKKNDINITGDGNHTTIVTGDGNTTSSNDNKSSGGDSGSGDGGAGTTN